MKIILTENQYNRIFLGDVLNIEGLYINEQNKNKTIILPEPNACQIQKFLEKNGFLEKDGYTYCKFGDSSAEAFAEYYKKFGPMKTLRELYDELKVMRYPVGEEFGFGPKMAKVISDLIKEKEGKGKKVLQTSEKCENVCKKSDGVDQETLDWVFSSEGQKLIWGKNLTPSKKNQSISTNLNLVSSKNNCMKCHSVYGALGLNDRINAPDGDLSYLPSYYEMINNPDLAKKHSNIFNAFQQANFVGMPNALDRYLETWTVQDWIDAAATLAFAIGTVFPPAALIGIGLEGLNVIISAYSLYAGEGSWTDLGIRVIFLFGGPFIGRLIAKGIGLSFNAIKYVFGKVLNLFKRLGGIKMSKEAAEKIVREEFKNFTKEERELAEKLLKEINENPDKFKREIEKIEKLAKRVENGDKSAINELKKAQEKAIRRNLIDEINPFSGNKTHTIDTGFGKIKVNKYWADIFDFPRTKLGLTIFLGIFLSVEAYGFYSFLEMEGYNKEQIKKIVNEQLLKETNLKGDIASFFKKYAANEKPSGDIESDMALLLSEGLTEQEYNKIVAKIDKAMSEYEKYHKEISTEIGNLKKDSNNLGWLYNNFCYIPDEFKDSIGNEVTVIGKQSEKVKFLRKNIIKTKGIKYDNYWLVLKGKNKGIWKEDKEGNFNNITSNCEESIPLVNGICRSNNSKFSEFCSTIELIGLSDEEKIDLIIDIKDGRGNDNPITKRTKDVWDNWD